MTLSRSLIVLLIGVMVSLTPVAQASPPDQSWLGGFYDDADYDDAVLSITSAVGVLVFESYGDTGFIHSVVALLIQADENSFAGPALSSTSSRGPPPTA